MAMGFCDDVKAAAEQIAAAKEVTIISHIDADGIACEAILSQAVSRYGIPVKSVFIRQMEPLTMPQIPSDASLKIFSDLGAGQQNLMLDRGFTDKEILIIDHHVSQPVEGCEYTQVNCLPYGFTRMSAAGVSYLVGKELDCANTDLAQLAVIGNVGDMMAREKCGLVGPARDIIVEDGARHGSVEVRKKDLNCYGTATRPLHLSLAYNDDPFIRGISNNPEGARQFLKRLGIRQQAPDGRWYVWEEIAAKDKRTIISALAEQLMANGEKLDRLLAETYGFPFETPRTPLRKRPGIRDRTECLRPLVETAGRQRHPPRGPGAGLPRCRAHAQQPPQHHPRPSPVHHRYRCERTGEPPVASRWGEVPGHDRRYRGRYGTLQAEQQ